MDMLTLAGGLALVSLSASIASLVVLSRLLAAVAEPSEPERLGARALREPLEVRGRPVSSTRRDDRQRLPPTLVARLMAEAASRRG